MHRILMIVTVLIFTAGCSLESKLSKMQAEAEASLRAGNEMAALAKYDELIARYEAENMHSECPVYDEAGLIALDAGQTMKGIEYLGKAVDYNQAGEAEMIALAGAYRQVDNLSKEIETLEGYLEQYPYGKKAKPFSKRLFETYVESGNWQEAYGLWPQIRMEGLNDKELLLHYFEVTRALEMEEESDEAAYRLQDLDPDNIEMMEYFGKKYYRLAEDRYQEEMAAYEANKTNKQYNQLVKALDVVTRHFRLSLSYFDKLFIRQPSPEYARYLANIYARLDNEAQAEYFRKMIE